MQSIYHRASKLQDHLLKALNELPQPSKVLLALSGGPDSRALFECLCALKDRERFELGVAHVDHRWREESRAEALSLKSLAEGLKIPFFLKTLDPSKLKGNLEESCRKERMQFFAEICRKEGYGAVFLAHHLGDQAETILKRVFEGSSFFGLQGMRPLVMQGGIAFVRPWLKVAKEEILAFLDDKKIPYFRDETNEDPRFLRGRMRVALLPFLEKQFGKNIAQPLERFGAEMSGLEEFLNEASQPILKEVIEGPFGTWLVRGDVHPFLCEHLLRRWFKDRFQAISHAQVKEAIDLYCSKKADKMVEFKDGSIALDRGRIFLLSPSYGEWRQEVDETEVEELRGLDNVWLGKLLVRVPKGKYLIGTPGQLLNEKEHAHLSKRWGEEGIPRFLRERAPLLKNEQGKVVEFFLKKRRPNEASFFTMNEQCDKITISVTWVRALPN